MNKVVLLGTKGGPRMEKGNSRHTSAVIEIAGRYYVIDCGLGVTRALIGAGYPLCDLQNIFITHHHCDHNLELGGLIYTAWNSNLKKSVSVYGPRETKSYFQGFFSMMNFDLNIRVHDEGIQDIREMLKIKEYKEGVIMQDDLVKVSALRNIHTPINESYALKFESENKKVVFSGDTAFFEPIIDFAKGADLLVHEVMLKKGLDWIVQKVLKTKPTIRQHLLAAHTLAKEVGEIATKAEAKHLALYHLLPSAGDGVTEQDFLEEVGQTWKGKTSVGRDDLVLEF